MRDTINLGLATERRELASAWADERHQGEHSALVTEHSTEESLHGADDSLLRGICRDIQLALVHPG